MKTILYSTFALLTLLALASVSLAGHHGYGRQQFNSRFSYYGSGYSGFSAGFYAQPLYVAPLIVVPPAQYVYPAPQPIVVSPIAAELTALQVAQAVYTVPGVASGQVEYRHQTTGRLIVLPVGVSAPHGYHRHVRNDRGVRR